MDSDRPCVELPSEIHERCERRIEGTEFETVEEYVGFVLEALFDQAEGDVTDQREINDEATKERLESLGYI